jgi:hypothetical protein
MGDVVDKKFGECDSLLSSNFHVTRQAQLVRLHIESIEVQSMDHFTCGNAQDRGTGFLSTYRVNARRV